MKIVNMEILPVEMKLAEPYMIAYETIDKTVNVFIKIATDKGISGFGCAAPDLEVTGETPQSVVDNLDGLIRDKLLGRDPLRITRIMEDLKNKKPDQPSTLAAVDMALFDILGKATNIPLWKILGGYRDRIKTSITVGIMPTPESC